MTRQLITQMLEALLHVQSQDDPDYTVNEAITEAHEYLAAPQPAELTDAQVADALAAWFSKEFEYNSSMETRMRAAIAAAKKGKA